MLKKHALFSIALLSSATLYAIPIESRGLSDSSTSANNITNSASPIAGNMNWDLMQKNQQLENQIRELRGKIEEQDHAIDQLTKELTNRYTDLDQRLELLNQKLEPENTEQTEAPAENTSSANATSADNNTAAVVPAKPINNTTTQKQNTTATAENNTNTSDPIALEKAAYTIALDAYKKGGAKQAIAPMQNFIKNYPNSIYTGNAHFWLAEFNLAIEPANYNEAKKNYETVASKFPNSSKASRALYQLYSIAKDVNKNTQAANVYKAKLLNTYPKSEEAGYFKKS
ncbi:tetratricopeptide repeat protein [Acinetobacter wuhouensis]|uniref:Tetratricopeptide repeat protein n=2 Tax=Acinetobacter wuhouensis TaxID=1879050 RepID=A0A4Q7AME1_9GAMM|nr:tetratricopeptide repeat protein [Acinetobacter wuhouensis]RZG73068.1 tetratricopeptide repeat protein [Acinetobacter wuhouensis]